MDQPIHVLHVDDDPDFLDLAATFLERENERFVVETAESATTGLDLLASDGFDCLVSDYDMPGTNGIEFLEACRENQPDLPFILFTGKGSEEVASEAISAGVTDYLQKEAGTDQYRILANRIRNYVERTRAQQEREAMRQRMNHALEHTHSVIFEINLDSGTVAREGNFERLLDRPREELPTWETFLSEAVHPEDREQVRRFYQNLINGDRTSGEIEYRTTPRDGSLQWIKDIVYVDTTSSRDDRKALGLARNITERKAREHERQRLLDLFNQTQDIAQIGGWEADPDTGEVLFTEGLSRLVGIDPQTELSLDDAFDFFHPEDEQAARETFERLLEDFEPEGIECRIITRHGDVRWVHVRGVPSLDGDSRIVRGIVNDITDQKRREQYLERYELIVETASDPIYTLDANMHFTLVNTAVAEFTGLDQEELTGAHIATAIGDDHAEAIADATTLLLSSDERQTTIETRSAAASGEDHIFQTTITQKPTSKDEAFRGVVCVSRDVSGLKEHERRLSVLDRVLRHNLRNKMNVIVGEATLIKETTDEADILGSIERIDSASQELLSLGDSARQFHSVLEPSESVSVDTKNVAEIARRVVAEIDTGESDSSVSVDAPQEAWAETHEALELSITELIDNAIQHSETAVEVAVNVTVDHDVGSVIIRVTDDGPGIPDRERRALMSGMESPLEHTMGLGLWFVRWMATNSGGSMRIAENEPTGTVVEIRFPLTNQIDNTTVT